MAENFNVTSFLFGNVTTEGDLDQDFDEETSDHIASLSGTAIAKSLFRLDFGDDDKTRFAEDDTDYEIKASNAVDYEDIEELAEEVVHTDTYLKKGLQYLESATKPRVQKQEEDYDTPLEEKPKKLQFPLPQQPRITEQKKTRKRGKGRKQ